MWEMRDKTMNKLGAHSTILWLVIIVCFVFISPSHSQDLFSQMDQVKKDISDLKAQVQQLSNIVYDMRRVLLGSAIGSEQKKAEQAQPAEAKTAKQEPPVDEEKLTKVICEAVGTFFSEAEAVLRSSDGYSANSRMNNVLKKLTTALAGYSETHRVSKLLNIYEGLAWDTYTAVQLRESVTGNEEFLRVLRAHKEKYLATCPR
jgi:hypothetical protein